MTLRYILSGKEMWRWFLIVTIILKNKKVKLIVVEFPDYVIVWWDQLVLNKRWNREPAVETREEMKRVMQKRFVPTYYYQDLYNKLQNLR